MKKLIFLCLLGILSSGLVYADTLEVKSNIPSGIYDTPIEVNLITNDTNAKIFYYTDGEGRMDHIKEFTNPIVIKENTQLDFYATSINYTDTRIQTSQYTFHYSNKINIEDKNGQIILKNNSGDVQNIGYWTIETDNLNYTIPANTFLENKETYALDYTLQDKETAILYSPDHQEKHTYTFKKEEKKENIPKETTTIAKETIKTVPIEENIVSTSGLALPESIFQSGKMEQYLQTNTENNTGEISQNMKSSLLESNTPSTSHQKESNNIYYIIGLLIIVLGYNVGLFLKRTKQSKKTKQK